MLVRMIVWALTTLSDSWAENLLCEASTQLCLRLGQDAAP